MQWGNSFSLKRFRQVLGIKKLDKTAADIYETRNDYQRFNQKLHMFYQPFWKKSLEDINDANRLKNCVNMVEKNLKGYSIFDWAFMKSSEANLKATYTKLCAPNKGGTTWKNLETSLTPKSSKLESSIEKVTDIVKMMAGFYGADQVGVCKLDRRWVYSHYLDTETNSQHPIVFSDEPGFENVTSPTQLTDGTQIIPKDMKYVIVFIHEMNRLGISTAPSLSARATVFSTYSKMVNTVSSMAEFIRALGYNAIPCINDTAISIPMAIDAGLGQLGRNSKLINPLFGPRCRISKVITNLPLLPDKPIDFGVTEFCNVCKKCAEYCPVDAIPYGDRSYVPEGEYSQNAVLQWQLDHERCREYWAKTGANCGICIRCCPYNRETNFQHWFLTSLASITPKFNNIIVKIDDALGRGKRVSSDKIWNK